MATAAQAARAKLSCAVHGHQFSASWTIRPAWVGAGISIPKVHFDRQCSRCRATQHVWSDIVGDTTPRDRAMTLREWLEDHGATVPRPPGKVHFPPVAEVERMRRAGGGKG